MFGRSTPSTPLSEPYWFTEKLQQKPAHLEVEVDGCLIHARAWGDKHLPPLILVHGGGANSAWWDHIAPFFTGANYVLAPDLSGHGDSEARSAYDLDTWARELLAVASASCSLDRPKIVGHSLGGWVTATAASNYGKQIDSVVIIDSPLRERAPEESELRGYEPRSNGYRTRSEIVARFRALPDQALTLPYITRHIAIESVRENKSGWSWKFDPAIFSGNLLPETSTDHDLMEDTMNQMPCRIGYLRCGSGLVSPSMATRIRSILQLKGPFIDLPEAGHHPMLDQPLALVAALRTLLEFWSIT